jgi:hypothetical protein
MDLIAFPQFLRRYGIKMPVTSTPDIFPGALIEQRKRGYFRYGHLRQVLGGNEASWRVESKKSFVVTNTNEVPFGFSGWKL